MKKQFDLDGRSPLHRCSTRLRDIEEGSVLFVCTTSNGTLAITDMITLTSDWDIFACGIDDPKPKALGMSTITPEILCLVDLVEIGACPNIHGNWSSKAFSVLVSREGTVVDEQLWGMLPQDLVNGIALFAADFSNNPYLNEEQRLELKMTLLSKVGQSAQ